MHRILFVCLGNICRSPTAEAVMSALVHEQGLDQSIEVDSAGTGGWHVGSPPDERAGAAALQRGIILQGSARQVTRSDFDDFDLLVAMDSSNFSELRRMAPHEQTRAKVHLLREFDPQHKDAGDLDVPDPYYGGSSGFDDVLDLVQAACVGLLAQIMASEPA
jgi:protein-tyrosine phosphatase